MSRHNKNSDLFDLVAELDGIAAGMLEIFSGLDDTETVTKDALFGLARHLERVSEDIELSSEIKNPPAAVS